MICRSCKAPLAEPVLDLGLSPISNAFRLIDDPAPDELFPLRLFVCPSCFFAQVEDVAPRERHFHADYAYLSSASASWRAHVEAYARTMAQRLDLAAGDVVVEVGSNDGALSGAFAGMGLRTIGVDPAAKASLIAEHKGVETVVGFFGAALGERLAGEGVRARLMAANNVLAHVPDPNDFLAGFARVLAPGGLITFEFPLLLELVGQGQYDTIYHEHYSYLSLIALEPLLARHGLQMVDVERLPTHGGSARLHVRHAGAAEPSAAVRALMAEERAKGLADLAAYRRFAVRVAEHRAAMRDFIGGLKAEGRSICGFAAPAKATTLLNYCGVGRDSLDFVVDAAPTKQGRRIPGVGVPILAPERLFEAPSDVVLILAWNIGAEIAAQLEPLTGRGVRMAVPMPNPGFIE